MHTYYSGVKRILMLDECKRLALSANTMYTCYSRVHMLAEFVSSKIWLSVMTAHDMRLRNEA